MPPDFASILKAGQLLTMLQADYKWNAWEREFLAKMALATSKHPTPRQIEMLLELDSQLL